MIRALIDHVAHPNFGIYSLVFLFAFFVALFWWNYLVIPRSVHDEHAMIPFNDGESKGVSHE